MAEETTFKDYAVYVLLAALFIVSFYRFSLGMGDNYSRDLTIDQKQLDLTNLEKNINESKQLGEQWEQTFNADATFVDNGIIVVKSIWGVIQSVGASVGIFFNLFLGGLGSVFGLDVMVTGTILAILLIGLVFAGYKVIKQG